MKFRLGLLPVVVLVLASTGPAMAQDPYALRTAVGSEAYLWELRAKQRVLRSKGTPKPNAATLNQRSTTTGQYTPRPRTAADSMTPQTRNALAYWGNRQTQQTMAKLPTRPSFVQQASAVEPVAPSTSAKPFRAVDPHAAPTVSPYLQLFRQEFEEAAPAYHAYVRPQLEQQRQRRQSLAQRPAPVRRPTTAAVPTAGVHSQRFGNTGSFYSGWQR